MSQPDESPKPPDLERSLDPPADHGETSYRGSGKLVGKVVLVTGGDSGIGRAVAIAVAREGADVAIAYLHADDDAEESARWVRDAGRRAHLIKGDLADPAHCRGVIGRTLEALGRLDVLINNAAFQRTYDSLDQIPDEDWDRTFQVNITAMFHLCKAAVPHMPPGSSIVNTASVNADRPNATLLAYATTKGAIVNFTGGLGTLLADKGIRVNCVAPGPIWTPLIPSTMPADEVKDFGRQSPMKRPGQPAEVAPAYVWLASDQASYISGACVPVTGGVPMI